MDTELNPNRLLEMTKFLEPFGFEHLGNGKYTHRLINRGFDFSAASPDGIIKILFDKGFELGQMAKENEIKAALNIPY